jgi:SAM-dependent methyltransferase
MLAEFDAARYKAMTRDQWQSAADAWNAWGPFLHSWLEPATDVMLDMTHIGTGAHVLDVAAGAGDQTMQTAQRVGGQGRVLATDISSNLLAHCAANARRRELTNVETLLADGEDLPIPRESFDAVISRVGLIYFLDQQKALGGMRDALRTGGWVGAIVYASADENCFFSTPVSIIRRRASLPPPQPGQPGPFSLGQPGAIEATFERAGFRNVSAKKVQANLKMTSAAECVRFEKESFGALHQMLAGLDEHAKAEAWIEIGDALGKFQNADGFSGPCTLIVAAGQK